MRGCRCGLTYLDPPPVEPADPTIDHHTEGYYRYPARARARFARQVASGDRLLEVGCGDGSFLTAAHALGFEPHGIDAHPGRAERSAAATGFAIRHGLVENAPLDGGPFDVVFHVDLLSHFDEPRESLRIMADALGPDGLLVFEVGVFGGLDPSWYRWTGGVGLPWHRWLYSEDAVRTVLASAALEVVAVRRYTLFPATVLMRLRRLATSATGRHDDARSAGDRSGPSTQLRKLSDWAEYVLRYRVGRVMPRFGPLTLLVAARPIA
jgi:SAM-dependent methyltransferase